MSEVFMLVPVFTSQLYSQIFIVNVSINYFTLVHETRFF